MLQQQIDMANQQEHNIGFRIQNIETLQYAVLQENVDESKLAFAISFSYGLDAASKIIRTTFRYELMHEEKPAILIEIAVDCGIEPVSFDEKIKEANGFRIHTSLAIHMAMITVGTARGILHEKTKDLILNKYPIPTINVTQTINNDIVFAEQDPSPDAT